MAAPRRPFKPKTAGTSRHCRRGERGSLAGRPPPAAIEPALTGNRSRPVAPAAPAEQLIPRSALPTQPESRVTQDRHRRGDSQTGSAGPSQPDRGRVSQPADRRRQKSSAYPAGHSWTISCPVWANKGSPSQSQGRESAPGPGRDAAGHTEEAGLGRSPGRPGASRGVQGRPGESEGRSSARQWQSAGMWAGAALISHAIGAARAAFRCWLSIERGTAAIERQ